MPKRHTEEEAPAEHTTSEPTTVANSFTGTARNVAQVGVLHGGLHLHETPHRARRLILAVAIMLGAVVIVVLILVYPSAPQRRSAQPAAAQSPGPAAAPSAPDSSRVPQVRPADVRTVTVEVPGAKPATVDDLRIAVGTVGFTSTYNGSVDCGGGGNGPGGGSCHVVAGDGTGASTVGTIDFSVRTPAMTCTTSSVHVNDSVVIAQPQGGWTRIVVLAIGPNKPQTGKLPVVFEVTRGHSGPAPDSPKVCVHQ